jgi:uncharacterized protein with PIN domain
MPTISIRFYAELNDFLPYRMRQRAKEQVVDHAATIKDVIEALGVPHTEVDLILVNGETVDFAYMPRQGDRISVYPVFESLDISGLERLRPVPLRDPRFVLDVHLGRLAAYLRLLGFDTLYTNDYDDPTLARISRDERRILLTRDRGLLKRTAVTHGYFVRETSPQRQMAEVVRRFDLACALAPFTRCLRCNAPLIPASKETILDRLPDRVRAAQEAFWQCSSCGQVYWQGTHHARMQRLIASLAVETSAEETDAKPGEEHSGTRAGATSG